MSLPIWSTDQTQMSTTKRKIAEIPCAGIHELIGTSVS